MPVNTKRQIDQTHTRLSLTRQLQSAEQLIDGLTTVTARMLAMERVHVNSSPPVTQTHFEAKDVADVGRAQQSPKDRPIAESSISLEQSISSLFSTIDGLEDQLGPVLAPMPPNASTGAPTNRPGASNLASMLSDFKDRIVTARDRLQSLRQRIEL